MLEILASAHSKLSHRLLVASLATLRHHVGYSSPLPTSPLLVALQHSNLEHALLLAHERLPSIEEELRSWSAEDDALVSLACRSPRDSRSLILVDLLLSSGAYAGAWDASGLCALHVAVVNHCDDCMVLVFTRHDQDLNIRTETAMSPLQLAVQCDNALAFQALVKCGADVHVTTPDSRLGLIELAAAQRASLSRTMRRQVRRLVVPRTAAAKHALTLLAQDGDGYDDDADTFTTGKTQVLRITLLGLQTTAATDTIPEDPANDSPPPSPSPPVLSRSSSVEAVGTTRGRSSQRRSSPERRPRCSDCRALSPAPLNEATLAFIKEQETATLALVVQEVRVEAQAWLKKRTGQKKLLSEARAQQQTTDNQRLQAFTAMAAKEFIDKHVADRVADAATRIERAKQRILRSTGVYPGPPPPPYG